MQYERDEEKSRANVAKRQLPFSEVENFDWDTDIIRRADRYQELRWSAIGYIGERLPEDAAVMAFIESAPDTFELDAEWFAGARPAIEVFS